MRASMLLTAVSFVIAIPLAAQNVEVVRLQNGLKLSAITDTRATTLEVTTRYFAGSRNDPDSLRGLAHLTEHLGMREVRGRTSIAVMLGQLGIRTGAVTLDSQTVFTYEAVPDDSLLVRIFEIEHLRMTALSILPQSLDVERRRVAAEVGTRHPDLHRVAVEDVRRFHSRYYTAANCSITVRSPLPSAAVVRLAEARFGPATQRAVVATAPTRLPMESGSESRWTAPDTNGLAWKQGSPAFHWLAARGGNNDSVFFAALVTVSPDLPSARDVGALELFARGWTVLRDSNGRAVAESLAVLGASVQMSSLPYPPLATTDAFRELATPLTPLGMVGLQLYGTVPRRSWSQTLMLVADAITRGGVPDSAADVEIERQRSLLEQSAALPAAEVAFRRSVPSVPRSAGAAWRPAPLDSQLAIMRSMSASAVRHVPDMLLRHGTVRLAILGVSDNEARQFLDNSAFVRLGGDVVPSERPSCDSPAETHVPGKVTRVEVFFATCIPVRGDMRSLAVHNVVNAILGGREDAVLAARLRTQTGLVYAFESRLLSTADDHALHWQLRVSALSENSADVIAEVRTLLRRISEDGVTDAQLADFRQWLSNQRLRRATVGRDWTRAAVFGAWPEADAMAIRAVTLAEVNAALKQWSPHRIAITTIRNVP